jgi:hypothetical protein
MKRFGPVLIVAVAIGVAVTGCARVTLPGRQFREQPADTSTTEPVRSPLPPQPVLEFGPADAPVRVVAFYPIDDQHQRLIDLLKELVNQYPGKVYVRYIDYRTPEGAQAAQRAGMQSQGLMINSQRSITINAKPNPYTVEFSQPMGRYWTADDLRKAVAQEVAHPTPIRPMSSAPPEGMREARRSPMMRRGR